MAQKFAEQVATRRCMIELGPASSSLLPSMTWNLARGNIGEGDISPFNLGVILC